MDTSLWPYSIPTQDGIRRSPRALPEALAQDDSIAFLSGATPSRVAKVKSSDPAGTNNGVVECVTVWSENPALVGKSRSYQWRSIVAAQARLYTPVPAPGQPVPAGPTPPPGMLAALSCVDQSIRTGFQQSYANQSELADKVDETNRLLGELVSMFRSAWCSEEEAP